jgi:hypothetical protein
MTHDDARPAGPAAACGACPICAGMAALRHARPEAVEHLLKAGAELVKAGAELVLAVRALLEEPAREHRPAGEGRPAPRPADRRLHRIDVG